MSSNKAWTLRQKNFVLKSISLNSFKKIVEVKENADVNYKALFRL